MTLRVLYQNIVNIFLNVTPMQILKQHFYKFFDNHYLINHHVTYLLYNIE